MTSRVRTHQSGGEDTACSYSDAVCFVASTHHDSLGRYIALVELA